jgi:hypothetical protein
MGNYLMIKDVDFADVAVGQVNVETDYTILTTTSTSKKSVQKSMSTGDVSIGTSTNYSVITCDVSSYIGHTLFYKNAKRTDIATNIAWVGAAFFDGSGNALGSTYISHIYGSPANSWEWTSVEIPQDAATFRLSWRGGNYFGTTQEVRVSLDSE